MTASRIYLVMSRIGGTNPVAVSAQKEVQMNIPRYAPHSLPVALVLLLLLGLPLHATPTETLTNGDIIKLSKAGMSSGVIIEKINSSQTSFRTDVDSLLQLRQAGVPNDIIEAMVKQDTTQKAPAPSNTPTAATTTIPSPKERTTKRRLIQHVKMHRDGTTQDREIAMECWMTVNDSRTQIVHFDTDRIWSIVTDKDGKGTPFNYPWDDLKSGCFQTGGWSIPYMELNFPDQVLHLTYARRTADSIGSDRYVPEKNGNEYIFITLKNLLSDVTFSNKCK